VAICVPNSLLLAVYPALGQLSSAFDALTQDSVGRQGIREGLAVALGQDALVQHDDYSLVDLTLDQSAKDLAEAQHRLMD